MRWGGEKKERGEGDGKWRDLYIRLGIMLGKEGHGGREFLRIC